MAGAFVAVADDATAAYWNPAGLATGRLLSANIDHREAEGDTGGFVGLSMPVVALSYYRLRFSSRQDPGTVVVSTHNAGLSLAQSLTDVIAVGTTLRFSHRMRSAIDVDAGVLAVTGAVRIGVGTRNLRRAFDSTRTVRAGIAWRPDGALTVGLDADLTVSRAGRAAERVRSLAAGVERTIGTRAAARGGLRASLAGPASPLVSVGGSALVWGSLWVDGYGAVGIGNRDRGWGFGARLALGN